MSLAWEGYRLAGRYELQELLGEGGMSAVYKAFDHNLKRTVAVKIIHPHLAKDPDFVRRFETEARAVAQLRHPNIVQVFDFAHEGELYYMVLEYIPGESLQKILARLRERGERLPLPEVLRLMVRLADAVDYAHQQGMIHRDIKPANIILTPQGEPILTDFGLARIVGGSQHTRTGMVMGTVYYMAPEQVRGEHVDHRADIYALGVVLFELLTGRPPFTGQNLAEIMQQHLEAPIPDPQTLVPDLPDVLSLVVKRALAKDPEERYATAGELRADLETLLAGASSAPPVVALSETLSEEAPVLAPSGTVIEPRDSLASGEFAAPQAAAGPGSQGGGLSPEGRPAPEEAASATSPPASQLASLVREATKERGPTRLYPMAALEAAMLAGLFAGAAYLVYRVELLWVAVAWWGMALWVLLRSAPAWWRLSSAYRLTLAAAGAGGERNEMPNPTDLLARFRVPRLDFPQDMELLLFPAALSAVLTTGVAMAAIFGASRVALTVVWLVVSLLLTLFHMRFMALNFLQPGVLDRLHFGHFLLSLSLGMLALPGMALAAGLPAGLRDGALVVALGAFGVGGMLGALALIFLLRRALTVGLPQPALAPLVFFIGPLVAVYTMFTLLLLNYLRAFGLPVPEVTFSLIVLTAWGVGLAGEALALMVYQGYRRAGVPRGPLRWGWVDALVGPGLLAVASWGAGLRYPLVVAVGIAGGVLGALTFLWVAWEVRRNG